MNAALRILGPDPKAAADEASQLLQAITGEEPAILPEQPSEAGRRDLATGLAVTSLVLTVVLTAPQTAAAIMQIRDRLTRRDLRARVEAAKKALSSHSCEAVLEIEGVGSVDLVRDPTDAVVDRIMNELGK